MITDKFFSAVLDRPMSKDAGYLSIHMADMGRLLSLIPEDETMYLVLKDNLYMEWVLVENQCGALVVTRGQGGTAPQKFPAGACVYAEPLSPVVAWAICNLDCCDDPDCPCVLIGTQDIIVPEAKVGEPWSCTAVFTGDLPMRFGTTGMPSWMTAEAGANFVTFSGTPLGLGTYNIGISGTNCSGRGTVAQVLLVSVTE